MRVLSGMTEASTTIFKQRTERKLNVIASPRLCGRVAPLWLPQRGGEGVCGGGGSWGGGGSDRAPTLVSALSPEQM